MIRLGDKLRLTDLEKQAFLADTGFPMPETVAQYNEAMRRTGNAWRRIGDANGCGEAKLLAAIFDDQVI
jgi:hypothetical protein